MLPECINPHHVDFPNASILNPHDRGGSGIHPSGVGIKVEKEKGCIRENDVWEFDSSGLMYVRIDVGQD